MVVRKRAEEADSEGPGRSGSSRRGGADAGRSPAFDLHLQAPASSANSQQPTAKSQKPKAPAQPLLPLFAPPSPPSPVSIPRGVFTIPVHLPFLDTLAAGLQAAIGDDPFTLSQATILLPTRRACRSLREAFLRASGGRALLLPRMRSMGDLGAEDLDAAGAQSGGAFDMIELPPVMPALRRQMLLTRLVLHWGERRHAGNERGGKLLPAQAAVLAGELARFLDEVQAEGCPMSGLADLCPADFAEHWQHILQFLGILTEFWPQILAEAGALDPAEHRNTVLRSLVEAWSREPPQRPVIAAGLTGGMPALDEVLGVIARLPAGAVVLPGLDHTADPWDWAAIAEDPTHPQHAMARLLERLDLEPGEIRVWPAASGEKQGKRTSGPAARGLLLQEILRPATTTEQWRHIAAIDPAVLEGLGWIDCPGPQEEAGVIALLMRQKLEIPGATAALVTPDRDLARRVAAELRRWKIEIDDSAGLPLNKTPQGVFLRLVVDLAAKDFAPVPLLAALKHPLAAAGRPPEILRRQVRFLERIALRGSRPGGGLAGLSGLAQGLEEKLGEKAEGSQRLIADLIGIFAPLTEALAAVETGFAPLVDAHIRTAEALAASVEESGAARLWREAEGEAAARFIADLLGASGDFPVLRGSDYPALFEALLGQGVVRPAYGRHPRLFIWGLVEARLQHADLMILSGLNEGSWPGATEADPWLSRPMRRRLGLGPPERRIGIEAHDFALGLGAREVMMTRASRSEGAPTVPCRWLLRLETVAKAAGLDIARIRRDEVLGWQAMLDRPEQRCPASAPEPRPPVAARPRKLSVTEIETWMRDPYAIYARHVLKLRKLDPIDADPGAAERGQYIHAALDRFVKEFPGALAADALDRLLACGEDSFAPALSRPGVWAFWWPRFVRIAEWFVAEEAARRPLLAETWSELSGRMVLEGPAGPFELTTQADRIDREREGGLVLIDYKTGSVPTKEAVELGFSPQLPLEAAILESGGFEGFAAGCRVDSLAYWRLSGGDPAGETRILAIGEDARKLIAVSLDGFRRLVVEYDCADRPYLAYPRPDWALRYNDYAHLARIKEWGPMAGGD
jgi:ATP-dependent helicase/nuclease subunit B